MSRTPVSCSLLVCLVTQELQQAAAESLEAVEAEAKAVIGEREAELAKVQAAMEARVAQLQAQLEEAQDAVDEARQARVCVSVERAGMRVSTGSFRGVVYRPGEDVCGVRTVVRGM